MTHAVFNRQINCLKQIHQDIYLQKFTCSDSSIFPHWNCSIMYKHPHVCLYASCAEKEGSGPEAGPVF